MSTPDRSVGPVFWAGAVITFAACGLGLATHLLLAPAWGLQPALVQSLKAGFSFGVAAVLGSTAFRRLLGWLPREGAP